LIQIPRPLLASLSVAVIALPGSAPPAAAASPAAAAPPRERFTNADVSYDFVRNQRGDRLRTFVTRPRGSSGKVPAIFFVGWLSCDSVEYAAGETDGFGAFLRRLIEQSGWATVRMDKPGVGESEGTRCDKADFLGEMEGYQAAFAAMQRYDFIDLDRVFVVGMSNGGGVGPLAARGRAVRGYVALGSWGRTWFEHMLDAERQRLVGQGKSPAEVTQAIKPLGELYLDYLIHGMTPGEVLARHPDWKPLWNDAPDGQYGRPAAFYQQLQGLNLGEIWSRVDVPVLVVRGGRDAIMSRADSEAIVDQVNAVHAGRARYLEVEGMTHGFMVNGKFHDALVPTVLEWMRDRLHGG